MSNMEAFTIEDGVLKKYEGKGIESNIVMLIGW